MKCLKQLLLLTFSTLIISNILVSSKVLAQGTNLTLEHFDLQVSLSSPKISPDGKNILLVSRKVELEENKYINTLWLVNIDTKETKPLTHNRPSVNQPNWSPKGDYISFLAIDKNQKSQIFKIPVNGGEAQQVTDSKEGVISYKWSPDGLLFAYVQKDSILEKSGTEKHNKSFEVGYDWYLADRPAMPAHIWICNNEGKNEYRLTSGESGYKILLGSMNWSPDGKKLVYIAQPKPHSLYFLMSSLQLINLDTKEITILDKGPGVLVNPSFSKNGSTVLYSKSRGEEPFFNPHGIFSLNEKGEISSDVILDIDRHIFDHLWFNDEDFLVGAPNGTTISLWKGRVNGEYWQLDMKGIIPSLHNMDIGTSDEIVFVGSTSQGPSELYYMKNAKSIPEKITSFNDAISQLNLGEVISINWKSEDDFYEDGVLTYPPDFSTDRKYPLVLFIHGGPMSSSVESFNFFAQALAAQGWIVFQPNYRGSNNLGGAYQRAVINDAGEGPGRDVMAGIEAIKKLNIIDESQIAVSGWSYGGFMTVWLTSHYQGWKSAVAGAAVTDWFDYYNLSDLNIWSGYGLGGSPWLNDNAENYRRQSPITYAHQIKTPTLILSNTLDPRVTVTQSFKLFHNLRDNGTETKFIAYPISGHFPQDPIHTKDVHKRWITWIKNHF